MRPVATLFAVVPAALLATTSLFGQTAPAKPAVHHAATSAATASGANAPGIPKVAGLPKTLYSLRYVDLVVGKGELAEPRKWYTVNYTGWLTTGKKFDSSFDRNQPITFPYGARRVIAGWDTGFEGMHVGGKRRLLIPYQLAYGEMGNPTIPPKSNLIFDIELLSISDKPPAQPAPPAGAAPSGAKPATPPPAGTAPANPGGTAPATTPATPSTPSGTAPNPATEQAKPAKPAPSSK